MPGLRGTHVCDTVPSMWSQLLGGILAPGALAPSSWAMCSCAGMASKFECEIPKAALIVRAKVRSIEAPPRPPVPAQPSSGVYSGNRVSARSGGFNGVRIPRSSSEFTVTLDVEETFRGTAPQPFIVKTTLQSSACDYNLQAGQDYLIFADPHQGNYPIVTCSATQPAAAAASRIRQLRAERDGTPLPRLYGSVLTSPRNNGENREEDIRPLPHLTVIARSEHGEFRAETDDAGIYEFRDIPAGPYRVRLEPDAQHTFLGRIGVEEGQTSALQEGRCALNFEAFGNGRVNGTVLDREGHPLNGSITAEDPKATGGSAPGHSVVVQEGHFQFTQLWPGTYHLSFWPSDPQRSEPSYYPVTKSKANAQTITIKEGTQLDGLQFVVE